METRYEVVSFLTELEGACGHIVADGLVSLDYAKELAEKAIAGDDADYCIISSYQCTSLRQVCIIE